MPLINFLRRSFLINIAGSLLLLTACLFTNIAYSQNTGIGTTAPLDKLHVASGNLTIENATYPWLSFRNSGGILKGYIGASNNDVRIGTWPISNTTGNIELVTNGVDRFRITSDGDVGIAVTNPRGLFDIGGTNEGVYLASNTITGNQRIAYMPGDIFMSPWSGTNTSYLEARRSDNSGSTNLQFRTYFSGLPRNALFISSDGKIGINTSNPGGTLEVLQRGSRGFLLENPNGDNWEQTVTFDNNGFPPATLQFIYNGALKAQVSTTTGAWSTVSDARLKKNIISLTPVLEKLNKLIPCGYEMIHDNPKKERTIGFIAQDVEKLFPEAVEHNPSTLDGVNTELLSLNYTYLGVVAIKAIQEQQLLISGLKLRIEKLEQLLISKK